MKNNYLFINASVDPYYNLALEEYLLTHYMEGTIMMLWQNENTIVVGRHQNAMEEINQKYVKEHGIRVVRRTTGGGAVYHDLGNLNYSFITNRNGEEAEEMKRLVVPIVDTLCQLGARASFNGRNDIVIDGKKVSGTAQRVHKNRILHHGCILFDSDLSVVAKSLNVRSEKFHSKAVKSVKGRVGNVVDFLPSPVSIEEFKQCLVHTFMEEDPYTLLEFSEKEKREIQKLRNEKYAVWEWTYGHPIQYTVHNYKKYDGGTVEVYMRVDHGRIEECLMYGDFMALRPASDVAQRLTGCRYHYTEVLNILAEFKISEYFGSIGAEEVSACICCVAG